MPTTIPKGEPIEPVDLLIRHGYIITMDDDATVIDDGAVAVRGRDIVAVGDDAAIAGTYEGQRIIDAGGAPVHPGLVECHLHATFQTYRGAVDGFIPEEEFFDAFELAFYNNVAPEEEYLAVVLSAMEMVRNGTTCFMEAGTVLEPDVAAKGATEVGIRALIGDAFIWDQPTALAMGKGTVDGAPMPEKGLIRHASADPAGARARLGEQLRRNDDPHALVRGHVAVLGLGTASAELLLEAKRVADAAGTVVNLHHAYSPADTAADRLRYGRDPLVHLAEIGFLDDNITMAHANHLTDAECDLIIATGANLAWAPAASMMWGHDGSFRGRHAELHRRGGTVALGSDSANWSNSFDVFRQANLALLTARASHGDPTYLLAEDVMHMATRSGAEAVGMADRIGALTAGRRADIVIHSMARPELNPRTNMLRNLMYSSGSKSVRTVVIDGSVVLEDGRFTRLDETAMLERINDGSRALLERMNVTIGQDRRVRSVSE